MFKKTTFILFILIFILFNLSIIMGVNKQENLINKYFRIHIVANSDSIDDQILKLKVSKAVNSYIHSLTENITDKSELKKIVTENIYNILEVAQKIITDNGYAYSVKGYIGKIHYDEKIKDEIIMASGTYDSLKIVIGEGKGENWWSLLFPNSIEGLEINDVMSNNDITFSFGIIDFFKNMFNDIKTTD